MPSHVAGSGASPNRDVSFQQKEDKNEKLKII
jgi:hypothetical protein